MFQPEMHPTVDAYLRRRELLERDGFEAVVRVNQVTLMDDGRSLKVPEHREGLRLGVMPLTCLWKSVGLRQPLEDRVPGELQAMVWNKLRDQRIRGDRRFELRGKGNEIHTLHEVERRIPLPRLSRLLQAVAERAPAGAGLLRVYEEYPGQANPDLSILGFGDAAIAHPIKDDTFAAGVRIEVTPSGSLRIGGSLLRFVCSNGAFTKVCIPGLAQIRRQAGWTEEQFLDRARLCASAAWAQLEGNFRGLGELAKRRLPLASADLGDEPLLRSLLGRPLHLTRTVARSVLRELAREVRGSDGATHFDLWNALTAASKIAGLRPTLRSRMRFGAGHLARSVTHVCGCCGQLVFLE